MSEKFTTPKFRVSFPNVFKAKLNDLSGENEFNIVMLFDKKDDLSTLKKAIKAAVKDKWADKVPKNLRNPIRDGDEKEREEYEGKFFVNAKSKQKPGVVDEGLNMITDPSDFYAGCYARATLVAYAYDVKGNRGVAFGLQNIQKLDDGEAFSGKVKAEDDFDPVTESKAQAEDSDDDFDNMMAE